MTLMRGDQMLLMMSDFCYYDQASSEIAQQQKGEEAKKRRRQKRCKKREDQGLGALKRKLTKQQTDYLEFSFDKEQKLDVDRKHRLASEINLEPRQVAVWFQNRRQKMKYKKMEEEYSTLKAQHQSNVVEKCQLETQVMKLKEKISQLQRENHRLKEGSYSLFSRNSHTSTFLVEDVVLVRREDHNKLKQSNKVLDQS